MANIRNIQFLRNEEPFSSLTAAQEALINQAKTMMDGSPIIGRYTVGEGSSAVTRTILGIVNKNEGEEGKVVFFNNKDEIDNVLDGLDFGPIGYTNSSVVYGVGQADGKISAATVNVGTLLLTEYTEGSESGHVDATDSINAGIAKLQNQIDAANDKVNALDASSVSGANKVVVDVTQEDGKITATAANITGIKLEGYTEGSDADVAATDTLGQALGKLQAQINAMDKTASAVDGQVVTTVTEEDGKVTETKANVKDLQLGGYSKGTDTGAISSTDTVNVALSKLENKIGSNHIINTDKSINVTTGDTATTIDVNIKSGEHVLAKGGNAGVYTDIKLSGITPSNTNVREEYALIGTDGTQLGTSVKVYKDSALKSVYIGHVDDTINTSTGQQTTTGTGDTALCFIYHKEDGSYELAAVDVQVFLEETEFASGVTATNHVVHGVVDTTSEGNESNIPFLTVGENGFKVSGIKDAIDTKINKLDATVSSETTSKHVAVEIVEADGKLTSVTVTDSDIASATALTAEINARKAVDGQTGQTYTANTSSNYIGGATNLNDADVKLAAALTTVSGHTDNAEAAVGLNADGTHKSASGHYTSTATTIAGEINNVDAALYGLSGKTFTEVGSANNSITLTTTATTAGTVKVDAQTDASKISGLTAESSITSGAAKVSGVSATDSVQTGIKNLYASLKSEIAARKAAINARTISSSNKAIVVTETPNEDGFSTSLALTLDTTTVGTGAEHNGTNALTITNDGLFLSTDWECGTF